VAAQGASITQASTFDGGTGKIVINGTIDQTFTGSATTTAGYLPNIEISKDPGSTLYLAGTIRTAKNWTYTQGTLDATTNDSTVVFVPVGTPSVITGSHTLDNVRIDSNSILTGTLTIASGTTLTIAGTLTIDNSSTGTMTINTGIISVQGNVTIGAGATAYNGTTILTFSGSGTPTFDLTGAEALLDLDIKVNKSGGQVDLISTLTMDAANQDLIIEEGVFNINGNTLTVSGTGKTFVLESGGNLQLQGGETVTTPTTISSGSIVTYVGADAAVTVKDWLYKTLTFNAPGKQFNWTASTTYTVAENFNVYGTFGNNVVFRSTSSPTTWGINNTGATEDVHFVDVQDSVATEEIIAVGGLDSDNNTNWVWRGNVPLTIKGGPLLFKGGYTIK